MGNQSLKEYLAEERKISRGRIASVFVGGAFCGAILTFAFLMLGLV